MRIKHAAFFIWMLWCFVAKMRYKGIKQRGDLFLKMGIFRLTSISMCCRLMALFPNLRLKAFGKRFGPEEAVVGEKSILEFFFAPGGISPTK